MTSSRFVKFLESFSVIGFVFAFWRFDLLTATGVLMGLTTLFVVVSRLLRVPLTRLQLGTWLVSLLLGGLTILLQDEIYIKWKPTVINATLATAFLLSHVIGDKTLVERLASDKLVAPRSILRRLNTALACHLLFVSALNILIAYQFETAIWVNFKLFGTLALNFLFLAGAMLYLRPYLKDFIHRLEKGN